MSTSGSHSLQPYEFTDAMSQLPSGVAVIAVRDELDDLVTTASSLVSVSLDPPLISIGTDNDSYFGEALARAQAWSVTVLAADQRHLAGRCSAKGRPSARLLLEGESHHRGAASGALIIDGGVCALECRTVQRIAAGDHHIVVASVMAIEYIDPDRPPLLRLRRAYRSAV